MKETKLENAKSTFSPEAAAKALAARIDLETVPNFKHVIQKISEAFSAAIGTDDAEKRKNCLKDLRMHYGYLGEKYRDTPGEREYIEEVRKAVEYLEAELNPKKSAELVPDSDENQGDLMERIRSFKGDLEAGLQILESPKSINVYNILIKMLGRAEKETNEAKKKELLRMIYNVYEKEG